MNNKHQVRINNRGVAMIVVLLVVIALSMLASGLILITTTDLFVSRNQAYSKEAFWAAEAGLRHAERVLARFSNKEDVTKLYDRGHDSDCFAYGPTGAPIGYKLYDLNGTGNWVAGKMDTRPDYGFPNDYEVFIANNYGMGEVNPDLSLIEEEHDGIIFVRSVGYSFMHTRRILEEEIQLITPIVDASKDQYGGGEGNVNPQ